jgi:prepilin-type N-terminal cleavage/methylation domain-containing protein
MRDRFRLLRQRDEGLTLVELMVTMLVLGIAMAVVMSALLGIQTFTRDAQGSADANFEARQAIAQIDRQVRSGNVLYSPANETEPSTCTPDGTDAGTCMRVYTQANGSERCVQWQVLADPADAGRQMLRSRSWAPTWQTDGNYTGWVTQARGLVLSPSEPPFRLEGAVTASSSRFLVVHFEAHDDRRDKPVTITSSVSGRNTNYGHDGGVCTPAPPTT